MQRRVFLLMMPLLLGKCARGYGESIWLRRVPRAAFLFEDNRARHVGDILTVIVRETNNIGQREQRGLSKEQNLSGFLSMKGSTTAGSMSRAGDVGVETSTSTSHGFDGNAQFTSDRRFEDRMTVTVVDVLPNGNLVIEGNRTRVVSGEQRHLRVTGVVRPADLSPGNTLFSESIANFRVEYLGRGIDSKFTTPGYFGKIMNYLWP